MSIVRKEEDMTILMDNTKQCFVLCKGIMTIDMPTSLLLQEIVEINPNFSLETLLEIYREQPDLCQR